MPVLLEQKQKPITSAEYSAKAFIRTVGIRQSLKGYYYLQDAICIGLEFPEGNLPSMQKIYKAIAEKHGIDSRCVERNIRHAINDAYHNDKKKLIHLFHYKVDKPYANEVITLGIELIRSGDFSDSRFLLH